MSAGFWGVRKVSKLSTRGAEGLNEDSCCVSRRHPTETPQSTLPPLAHLGL